VILSIRRNTESLVRKTDKLNFQQVVVGLYQIPLTGQSDYALWYGGAVFIVATHGIIELMPESKAA